MKGKSSPEPYPASKKIATVPEDEGYSWNNGFCDFAFGSAQNDRVGSILRRVKVFRSMNPTKRESAAMCIDIGLMLYALVLGWCCMQR